MQYFSLEQLLADAMLTINQKKEQNQMALKDLKEKEMTADDLSSLARNVDLKRTGTAIILPEDMSLKQGIEVLKHKMREEETVVAISEPIDAYPPDGAIAVCRAMSEMFGWTEMIPTPGFFGPKPPTMVAIKTGTKSTVRIPWGRFTIPGVEGFVQFSTQISNGRMIFVLAGETLQRTYPTVRRMCDLAREYAAKDSIYKGKALKFDAARGEMEAIEFVDLSGVNPDELVLSREVMSQVQYSLFAPIIHAERARAAGVPVKRGVLLEGSYGTGKTMTANVAALYCERAGRTFLYVEKAAQLAQALVVANLYAPSCVFCEDIDRVTDGERDEEIDLLANTIDGVTSKHSEIILVLTTNDVESIHPVMLRPGRLDAVISIPAPDAEAAQRLVRLYGRGMVSASDAEMVQIGEALAGKIPAVIREAVERAKLSAIFRSEPGTDLVISFDDLMVAAYGLNAQAALINRSVVDEKPTIDSVLREAVNDAVGGNGVTVSERISHVHDTAHQILNHVRG